MRPPDRSRQNGVNAADTIVQHEQHGNELVVHGALKAGGQVKHAFGGSTVTIDRGGVVVSMADDLKSAATDALKKACSLFGIGIDLYGMATTPPARDTPAPSRSRLEVVKPNEQPRTGSSATTTVRSTPQAPERLTAKQLKYIYAIGQRDGVSDSHLREISVEKFGVVPQYLNRKDASAFIDQLEAGEL